MFDAPTDVPSVWTGLVLVAAALFGVVGALPTTAPPDAAGAANAVDVVAAGEATAANGPLLATEGRVGPHRIDLRNDAGRTGAAFAFGPVAPVVDGPLVEVLEGASPRDVFESRETFRQAVVSAQSRPPTWRPADRLVIRRVRWDEFSVTLVGL